MSFDFVSWMFLLVFNIKSTANKVQLFGSRNDLLKKLMFESFRYFILTLIRFYIDQFQYNF